MNTTKQIPAVAAYTCLAPAPAFAQCADQSSQPQQTGGGSSGAATGSTKQNTQGLPFQPVEPSTSYNQNVSKQHAQGLPFQPVDPGTAYNDSAT